MKRFRFARAARRAGWVDGEEVKRLVQKAIDDTKVENEVTLLMASQAKEYADMYKKLLEISTQERIKFFQKDPRGLYQEVMQQLLVGQQFATAFERWRGDRDNKNLWGDLVEIASAFQHALRLVLPS